MKAKLFSFFIALIIATPVITAPAFGDYRVVLRNIEQAILSNPEMSTHKMTIGYMQGTITLEGEVADERSKMLAANIASRVDGVKTVNNKLRVNSALAPRTVEVPSIMARPNIQPTVVDDGSIASRLEQAYRNEGLYSRGNLNIGVNNGVVTLRGDAKSFRDVDHALSMALMIDGVTGINNQMTVNGNPYPITR